ncbi:MAG: hypothetical protein J6C19_15135 [Lachnospiraceae bacterium]|nr:hypothetical protein [Lachnospiraceae bacterium]
MEEGNVIVENEIKKDVWGAINTLRFTSKIGENAKRADRMFFEHLQEGLKSGDIDKIYEFIEAYERGRGLNSDPIVRKLFQKAYDEDAKRLCRILAEKDSIIDYWGYLSSNCETYMIVGFTKMDVEYPCFYYECARILLKRLQEDLLRQEGIITAVKKLADIDVKLWKRWLQKNESNPCWQKLLFTVLSQVDKKALEIFAQTIHLDMTIQDHKPDILSPAFESLSDSSKNYILVHVSGIILDRWKDLIEKKKKVFASINKPLFTGYINLILNSIQKSLQDKEKWKTAFLKQAEILEEDMYRWYDREINMESIFFYDITQLYYILIVGQECQLIEIDEVISDCGQKVKMVIERYDYFWRECEGQKADFEKHLRDNSIFK